VSKGNVTDAKEQINDEATDKDEEVKEIDNSDDVVENDYQDIEIVEDGTPLSRSVMSKIICDKLNTCEKFTEFTREEVMVYYEEKMELSEGTLKEPINFELFTSIIEDYKTSRLLLRSLQSDEDEVNDIAEVRILESGEMQQEKADEVVDKIESEVEIVDDKTSNPLEVSDAVEKYTYKDTLHGVFPIDRNDRLFAFNIICYISNLFIFNSFISHIIILSFLIFYPDISLKAAENVNAKDITIVGVASKYVALLDDDNDMQIRITWNNEEIEYMSLSTYNALYDRG
jgi:hypothetical protein